MMKAMELSSSPPHGAVVLLIGLRLLNLVSAVCNDVSNDNTYDSVRLPSGDIAWFCRNNGNYYQFDDGQVVLISSCSGRQVEVLCTNRSSTIPACSPPPTPSPANATNVAIFNLRPGNYLQYFICNTGKMWASGAPGHFSQCINGIWTTINDTCIEDNDCPDVPRDCSMIHKLGYNESGIYSVIPSGNKYDFGEEVWCDMSSDPSESGWTTVFKHVQNPPPPPTTNPSYGYPAPYNNITNYFIGGRKLSQLSWKSPIEYGNATRPLVFRFRGMVSSVPVQEFYATYDGVVIKRAPDFDLLSIGSYHGTPGNAFNSSYGKTMGDVWWNVSADLPGLKITSSDFRWETLPQSEQNLGFIYVSVRPKDFDAESSCPPSIGYNPSWREYIPIEFPPERREGTVIQYRCVDRQDSLDYSRVPKNTITCRKNGTTLFWDTIPNFPCGDNCPANYIKLPDRRACLRFSTETATFGITTASLKCSRENATLAKIANSSDMQSAVDGTLYYTAHVGMFTSGPQFEPQPPLDAYITCGDGACNIPSEALACLIISKNTTASKFFKNDHRCNDGQISYICELPAKCPTGFSLYRGLCYMVIDSYGSGYIQALRTCAQRASALAYPESPDVLEFIKKLVWSKIQGANYLNGSIPSADLPSSQKVLIGLNNLDGNWSSGYDYKIDATMIAMAGNSTEENYYRYLNVSTKWNDVSQLVPVPFTLDNDPGINYAVCQLHGPIGCWDDPPPALNNMHREWDGNKSVGTTVTYRCYPGYFVDDNTVTQQFVECRGQLGEWVPLSYEMLNCTLMEACSFDSVPCQNDSRIDIIAGQDVFMLNSSITYKCPPSMAMENGLTTWNSTCSVNPRGVFPAYIFSPNPMPGCIACTPNVSVDFSTTNWTYGNTYTLGNVVTITCNPDYIINQEGFVNSTTATCASWGWQPYISSISCKKACYVMPPTPSTGSNMQMPAVNSHYDGITLNYTCNSGYYIPAFSPALRNYVSVTCSNQGVWNLELLNVSALYCTEMCVKDPVTPLQGSSDWDKVSRTVGTNVNLTCPEGFAFPDRNRSIIITCAAGGNWTQQNTPAIETTCKMITYAQPTAPPNSILNTTESPPYWQGTVLNFTCPDKYMSSTGSTWTTLTFTGPNWSSADPAFSCLQACGAPTPAVDPVNMTFSGIGVEGEKAIYRCPGGFEGSPPPELMVLCMGGSWSRTVIPKCKMCNSTLPSAPKGVSVAPYDGAPVYGAVATHTCQGLFPDGTSTINVTCDQGAWNPQEIPECATPCLGAPLALSKGVTSIRYNVSLFEAVVTYTCAGAFLDTTTQINVTCNKGVWSQLDIPACSTVQRVIMYVGGFGSGQPAASSESVSELAADCIQPLKM
ncbi:uncharacterized protein [Macrobrachium rosenbergii]|uniref:uncharacterized protein n=1 Tax=Macrobrachium rosenbergii TaxID=79674 RepID=UPI0034D4F85E